MMIDAYVTMIMIMHVASHDDHDGNDDDHHVDHDPDNYCNC